jgi:glyoxylase-like metal-dependent hydrolase (beta-lactamase superfamily II)
LVEGEEPAVAPEENHIAIDRVVGEGDSIEVGPGTAYQVLETPGHSPCSLSFFDPERKVLIISDASGYYMPTHNDWWPNYFSDYGQYVASLERLAGLGAEVLCLSHNGAIRGADDVAAYFQGAIEATRRYHGRIVDEAATGKSPREIGEMLGTEIHEKTPLLPVDFFQKNCGLMAKLSLQHEKAAG